jgi:hypothetical protein
MDHMTPKDDRTPLPWAPKRTARERMRDMLSITSKQHDHDATLNTTTPDVERPYTDVSPRGYTRATVTPAGPVVEAGQPAQGTPQITTEPHPDAYGRQGARDLVRAMGGKLPLSEVLNADGTWTITAAGNIMDGVEVVKPAPGMSEVARIDDRLLVVRKKPVSPVERQAPKSERRWGYDYDTDDTFTRAEVQRILDEQREHYERVFGSGPADSERTLMGVDGTIDVLELDELQTPIYAAAAYAWNEMVNAELWGEAPARHEDGPL